MNISTYDANTDSFNLVMVGMRHIDGGAMYQKIKKDPKNYLITIVPEPENTADKRALAVYAGREGELSFKVGYIKAEHAHELDRHFYSIAKYQLFQASNITKFSQYYAVISIPRSSFAKTLNKLDDALDAIRYNTPINKTKEETKMTINSVIDKNTTVARNAAYLEAGRIANNQAVKFVAAKAPMMVRGYVTTPFGKLVIANMASIAADKFRAKDARLAKLTEAMMTEAWQEVYQIVDIEKMINEMLDSDSIKAALSKLEDQPE